MLMGGESSSLVMEDGSEGNDFGMDFLDEDGFGGADDLSLDMDMLLGIINEGLEEDDSDPAKMECAIYGWYKNCLEESGRSASQNDAIPDASNPAVSGDDLGCSNTLHPRNDSEGVDSRIGNLGDSALNHGLPLCLGRGSPGIAGSASPKDWFSLVPRDDASRIERVSLQRDNCNVLGFGNKFEVKEEKFRNPGAEENHEGFIKFGAFRQKSTGTMELFEPNSRTRDISSKESAVYPSSDVMKHYPATHYDTGADHPFCGSYNSHFPANEELMNSVKSEEGEFITDSACSSTKMKLNDHVGSSGRSASRVSMNNYFDMEGWNHGYESNDFASSMTCPLFDTNVGSVDDKPQLQRLDCSQSHICCEDELRDEKMKQPTLQSFSMWPYGVNEEANREISCADYNFVPEDSRSSYSGVSYSFSGHSTQNFMEEKKNVMADWKVYHSPDDANGGLTSFRGNGILSNSARQYLSPAQPITPISNQSLSLASHFSKVSPESSHSNFSEKSVVEDDSDICIIEDISHPAPIKQSPAMMNTSHLAHSNQFLPAKTGLVTSQRSTINGNHVVVVGVRPKATDERLLRRLIQDLAQPKSEMTPPDGLLAVNLLRHQKIALSWMVQKETDGSHCSGGILADDQGLGKTISTISLILKERPPSHRDCNVKQDKIETLNLDEDEGSPVLNGMKEEAHFPNGMKEEAVFPNGMKEEAVTLNAASDEAPKRKIPRVPLKFRPAAGTLIVCPTSVLRQWYDELRNKVTSKANLSVLVYHGSSRTKDPSELVKHDVVLTTYSIVSMEVPKQPPADEDDEERGKSEDDGFLEGLQSSKKRKYPPSFNKKRGNKKKSVTEVLSGPLAKVGWFRVVLDEAQSIKNYRTQVARACWGLRAKRRWCLSGTPIQNAIDDLYSYFRFLKFDPFISFNVFREHIKAPINRNPTNGYRKLQTLLRTIMLRRTKGTLLDGEPIIKLPPKSVKLKKVEFSQEERDFYSRLEADSRAQFQEYADAGTVKQNYVNILLMLLRLRQACDHPFLVKGVDSRSLLASSVETAKKLPRAEQEHLLRCLEDSLALCGVCNDPPEDAVVAKCGHVFCNQCISEKLTGDDHQCPSTNCKARLNISTVFSKVTLNSCLQDQPFQNCPDDCNSQTVVETMVSSTESLSFNSSKIKAALEILQSVCGPQQNCLPGNRLAQTMPEGNASSAGTCVGDIPESQNSDGVESSNPPIKVAGEKAIVFSQWTRMLDLLEDRLKDSSMKYRRLDGTMSVTARDKAVKDFNTLPEVTVMIMSLKAASLGLNMVAACHVLLLDLWWNPTTEDQAIDRAHRIGQTRPVSVLRLTVRDTVEDRILLLQQKKREMVASAFGEDENGGHQTRLTVEDLKYLFMT